MVSLAPVLTWVLHWYTAFLPWIAPGQHNADANTNVTVHDDAATAREACAMLEARLPRLTYFPGSKEYDSANAHYYVSSTQNSTCALLPSSPLHLASLMSVLHTTGAPFALKSGGHTANPGFSSTRGVQVSLARKGRGAPRRGLTWDEVYVRLAPIGVTVAGGRIPGVVPHRRSWLHPRRRYSWIANQVGMTRDTVHAYHLVLPSVPSSPRPVCRRQSCSMHYRCVALCHVFPLVSSFRPYLLFSPLFALLSYFFPTFLPLLIHVTAGLNNFGILTSVTLRAYPQGPIWVRRLNGLPNSSVPALIHAVAAWDRSSRTQEGDPKAQILAAFFSGEVRLFLPSHTKYDADPRTTARRRTWTLLRCTHLTAQHISVFSDIPHIYADVRTRTFLDFYTASYTPGGLRCGPPCHFPLSYIDMKQRPQ
ncbi:hypothetical protein BD779DRAFT_1572010 [Infundibulicybe gibba]|nr:hypothetical protein BD779DRAFT_1572010 [Infundibulicybe gibba]